MSRVYHRTKDSLPPDNIFIQWLTEKGEVFEGKYINGEWLQGTYNFVKVNYIPEFWIEKQ